MKEKMKIGFLVYLILTFSPASFSETFDFSRFCGTFQLSKKSNDVFSCEQQNKFLPEIASAKIRRFSKLNSQDADFKEYVGLENINMGRRTFDSCFSDGIRGYTEVVAKKNTITERLVYFKPGLFCSGTSVQKRYVSSYKIANERLIITMSVNGADRNANTICEYKKIEPCNLTDIR